MSFCGVKKQLGYLIIVQTMENSSQLIGWEEILMKLVISSTTILIGPHLRIYLPSLYVNLL